MTEETASQCQDVGPLVKKGNLTPWQAMCLHLLYEWACDEASFWYPYIAVLLTELELIGAHPMLPVMFRFSSPISRDNESEVLRRLLSTCDHLLQKYPTPYEQDVDMLETPGAKVLQIRALSDASFQRGGCRGPVNEGIILVPQTCD